MTLMRSLLLLAFAAALVGSSPGQTPSAASPAPVDIVKLEQHLWTTMAEGDFATVKSLFTQDFIQVDDRIQALDSVLIRLKHCKLESYELRDLQVRILTPESALTAYHLVNTFDCGTADTPKRESTDSNAVTVWVRQPASKRWLAQAHSETPVKH